jgi:hypothetical protein
MCNNTKMLVTYESLYSLRLEEKFNESDSPTTTTKAKRGRS